MVPVREGKSNLLFNANSVFKGLIAAFVITMIGCIMFGLTYSISSLSEKTLPVTASILFYSSIFIGSIYAARDAGFKGFVHGIGVAVLFVLLGWFMAKLILGAEVSFGSTMQKALISCVSGAFGGILGVGLSK